MKVSANFDLETLTFSETATRKGIVNSPGPLEIENLKRLCTVVLEPLKKQFPKMIVSSAFRSRKLNAAIGGSATSEHVNGNAADIYVPGVSPKDVAIWCSKNIKGFDQVIWEWNWTHIGLRSNPRGELLTARKGPDGKAVYSKGIA